MWPDRVSNTGPLTYKSDALPIVLRGPALIIRDYMKGKNIVISYLNYSAILIFEFFIKTQKYSEIKHLQK